MTAALDAIRARHVPHRVIYSRISGGHFYTSLKPKRGYKARRGWCDLCGSGQPWPCDAAQLLDDLDRAEAVVAAAREALRCWDEGADEFEDFERDFLPPLRAALRVYEDADKVAALADVAGEVTE